MNCPISRNRHAYIIYKRIFSLLYNNAITSIDTCGFLRVLEIFLATDDWLMNDLRAAACGLHRIHLHGAGPEPEGDPRHRGLHLRLSDRWVNERSWWSRWSDDLRFHIELTSNKHINSFVILFFFIPSREQLSQHLRSHPSLPDRAARLHEGVPQRRVQNRCLLPVQSDLTGKLWLSIEGDPLSWVGLGRHLGIIGEWTTPKF